ncbi:MAG: archease [Acidobacteria bacterium]|nr:archease [Acidobacteriota bacterium]
MYEIFEHTADLGLRIKASDLNTLFSEAGKGFFSLIVENIDDVALVETLEIKVNGQDLEYLLFDWLNELLYISETQHLVFSYFNVNIDNNGLTAKVSGEKIDYSRHILDHEVKAITYHGLVLKEEKTGWLAEVILDI